MFLIVRNTRYYVIPTMVNTVITVNHDHFITTNLVTIIVVVVITMIIVVDTSIVVSA